MNKKDAYIKYFFDNIENWICVFIMTVLIIVLTFQMVARLGGIQNTWTDELGRYLYIWLVYLGAGIAMLTQKHIKIEMLNNIWPKFSRKIIDYIGVWISIAYCAFILYGSFQYTMYVKTTGQMSGALAFPLWIIYISISIGFLSIIIRQIQMELIPKSKNLFVRNNPKGGREL